MTGCLCTRRRPCSTSGDSSRRGTIFNYFMVYLLLSGLLLSTAGLTLHTVLRTHTAQELAEQHLRSVRRAAELLRADAGTARSVHVPDESTLEITRADASVSTWTASGHQFRRVVSRDDQPIAREHLVLRPGSTVRVTPQSDALIAVQFREPPPVATRRRTEQAESEPDRGGETETAGPVVEVLLRTPAASRENTP